MAYTAKQGHVFYNFQKRESYIVHRLDNGKKRVSRDENSNDGMNNIPRHHDINSQGRTWTF